MNYDDDSDDDTKCLSHAMLGVLSQKLQVLQQPLFQCRTTILPLSSFYIWE